MLSGAISLIVTGAIALFVTLLVVSAHTVNKWVKLSFAGVLANLVLWQATIYVADNTLSHLIFWNHLVFLWPTLVALSFFSFVTLLRPSRNKTLLQAEASRSYVAITIVALAFFAQLVAIASGHIFSEVTFNSVANQYDFVRDIFYPIYILGLVGALLVGLVRLVLNLVTSKKHSQERGAFRTVLITVTAAMAYGITTNIVLPLVIDSQQYITLGLVTVDIFAVGLALSIIRHQFLDIRSYVFRAAVYILTLLCIAAVYVGAASLLSTQILHIALPTQGLIVLSLITLLVAASFQPLRTTFDHLTNRLFFRDYYSAQDVLDRLGDLLVGTVDVDEIKQGSQQLLKEAFNPTSLSYALHTAAHMVKVDQLFLDRLLESDFNVVSPFDVHPPQYEDIISGLKKRDIALAVRLRTKHGDLGYIMLGFRQSGADYSYADRKFIGVVADQLAIGLQNALRFEEIEKFNRTLQEKITEATKKLRHSNDKLRTLDQTKDDFISMASHQLRTPLTSVKGYVSMVLDGDAGSITPLQRKLLNQSFISSQRMVYLISDLLNVSRLRTGKFIIEPMPTDLSIIIREEVDQLTETARSRNLSLTFNRPEHFPHLMLDETKIRQVIMNFVDNAIYYTPSGGRITINLLDRPESIEFTVTDNGIGVPKAEQHHLFSKFYRAPNAKRARPDGTGLGLFMAKKVVIAQGGAVVFKSQEGKGSTFGFTFAKSHVAVPEKLAHTIKSA